MSPRPNNRDYLLLRAHQAGLDDPKELAAFMGQMEIESGNFRSLEENLNYRGERLLEMFKGRNGLRTLEQANAIAGAGPVAVANAIYGGEWGRTGTSGNTEPGDGWRFHGRGYIQLTGRYNYTRDGRELGLDLVGNPDLAADREIAADIAIHYWQSRVVPHGHQLDVRSATLDINGGYNHLEERRAAVARWETRLTPEAMKRLSQERPIERARDQDVAQDVERLPPSAAPDEPQRRQQYEGRVTPFSPVAPITQQDAKDHGMPSPAEPRHPDHDLLQQIRTGVAAIEQQAGRPYGESSERVSRSLLLACKRLDAEDRGDHGAAARSQVLGRVDHVVASQDGSRAIAIEGGLTDPTHRRVSICVADAIRTPVEEADRILADSLGREASERVRSREHVRAVDETERVRVTPTVA